MKSILIVSTGFTYTPDNYGGVNKMLLWLGNNLMGSFNITFCSIYDTTRSSKISDGIRSYELGISYNNSFIKRNSISLIRSIVELEKIFECNNFDYVVNFDGIVFFPLLYLKKKYGYKLIISERADPNYNHSFITRLKRRLYSKVDKIVFQTKGAMNYFSLKVKTKGCVIPNPIDIPSQIWRRDNSTKSIACVGRLDIWQKRQDVLIAAFSMVIQKHPEYILNIYGSGPDDKKLKLMAQEYCPNNIIFHGAVKNVKERIITDELFVLTSDFEGIPNALLEAMALGMPVISTRCSPGGAELLINDRENGLLSDCDNPKSVAESIKFMIENQNEADIMSRKARESVLSYSTSNIIKMWKEIFYE